MMEYPLSRTLNPNVIPIPNPQIKRNASSGVKKGLGWTGAGIYFRIMYTCQYGC